MEAPLITNIHGNQHRRVLFKEILLCNETVTGRSRAIVLLPLAHANALLGRFCCLQLLCCDSVASAPRESVQTLNKLICFEDLQHTVQQNGETFAMIAISFKKPPLQHKENLTWTLCFLYESTLPSTLCQK